MTEFGKNSFSSIQFILTWKSDFGIHEERYLARKINGWRDILPECVRETIKGSKSGETFVVDIPSGSELPGYDFAKVISVPLNRFMLRLPDRSMAEPQTGRFYPQGLLRGLPGIYPQTNTPFRVIGRTDSHLLADLNHPLANIAFTLEMRILNIAPKEGDTGGRLTHWLEEICNYGPGMQAALKECDTDYAHTAFYRRDNSADDSQFYRSPRLTGHIDTQASNNLQEVYRQFLGPEMRVLDLMSSMQSHLPSELKLDVTGLGMNMDELRMNPILNKRIIQDLNSQPQLDLPADSFDAITCSLSIEYLTNPLAVLQQAYNVLAPGGILLISFSNRWFPPKVIQGWTELHEFERMGFVLQLAKDAGFNGRSGTVSIRNDWRPVTDKHYQATMGVSDPVYIVWLRKN